MDSSLKERLARLGPVRDVSRVPSGSPAVIALTPARSLETVRAVTAALALAKRGLSLLRAKRVVEEMLADGRAVVELPTVEDVSELAKDLEDAGCTSAVIGHDVVDVRALRERLGLTQEQFAWNYALDVSAVRNWEADRRKPDPAALAYLRVIERLPEQVSMVLERPLATEAGKAGPKPTMTSVADMKAVAVAMMELLHPGRGTKTRRAVALLPEDKLGQLIMATERLEAARESVIPLGDEVSVTSSASV